MLAVKSANQPSPSLCENQPPSVAGNKIILEAKIGGITHAILILRGRYELCPPTILRPC